MTEELYSPYKLAIELGFNEEQARRFEWNSTNATNMRRIAKSLGLPSTKQDLAKPEPKPEPKPELAGEDAEPVTKPHRHSYRKDGSCRCGAVRKVTG